MSLKSPNQLNTFQKLSSQVFPVINVSSAALRHMFFALSVVLLFVVFTSSVFAAEFDLSYVNYPNPSVGIVYNDPVQIESAQLFFGLQTFSVQSPSGFSSGHSLSLDAASSLGEYRLVVSARNQYGQRTTDEVIFTRTDLGIEISEPYCGFGDSPNFPFVIRTFVDLPSSSSSSSSSSSGSGDLMEEKVFFNTECKYYLGSTPPADYANSAWKLLMPSEKIVDDPNQYAGQGVGSSHITTLSTSNSLMNIICRRFYLDGSPVEETTLKSFRVGVLEDGPQFLSLSQSPEIVFDSSNPFGAIIVETSDPSSCSISTIKSDGVEYSEQFTTDVDLSCELYGSSHVHTLDFSSSEGVNRRLVVDGDPVDTQRHEFEYSVSCTNKAGLTTTENILVVVDFKIPIGLSVISPSLYTNQNPVPIEVATDTAASCEVSDGLQVFDMTSSDDRSHSLLYPVSNSGNYSVNVTCTGLNSYVKRPLSFVVDTLPPSNILLTASELICDGDVSASVSAVDNVGIKEYVWELRDQSNNAVDSGVSSAPTFSSSVQNTGSYTWFVSVVDLAGNSAPANPVTVTVSQGNSDVCDSSPFIQYYDPVLGWDSEPFDIVVETKREARCRWVPYIPGIVDETVQHFPASSEDNLLHTLQENFNSPKRSMHIICDELSDPQSSPPSTHISILEFGVANAPPQILSAVASPNPIKDPLNKETLFSSTTDTDAVCSLVLFDTEYFAGENPAVYDSYSEDHSLQKSYPEVFDDELLEYTLACVDRADQSVEVPLPLSLSFAESFTIDVLEPGTSTNNPSVSFAISPRDVIAACSFREVDSGVAGSFLPLTNNNGVHSGSWPQILSEGVHSTVFRCEHPTLGVQQLPFTFVVDTTPPTLDILSNPYVCSGYASMLQFNISDSGSGANRSEVTVQYADGSSEFFVKSASLILSTEDKPLGTATVTVTAFDNAQNPTTQTALLSILEIDDPLCSVICGDGVVAGLEQCDDGNAENGDGCSTQCKLEGPLCGNGVISFIDGEQCEGEVPAGLSCASFDSFTQGLLSCTSCVLNTSSCSASSAVCGNGLLEPGEACDGSVPSGLSCSSLGFSGGALTCSDSCEFELTQCTGYPAGVCGDGVIANNEACDGNDIRTSCSELGFSGGSLGCDSCAFDTTFCKSPVICGDGVIQPGEQCDGDNWGPITSCSDIIDGFTGSPSCDPQTCLFDLSQCGGVPFCGDGWIDEGSEECEDGVPLLKSCSDFGFSGGELSCAQCGYDTSACIGEASVCGNGILEPGEECDGDADTACSLFGYSAGSASCSDSCTLDVSNCTGLVSGVCGDGELNNRELCDGLDVRATCSGLGFASGSLSCTANCRLNTASCAFVPSVCGDGVIQPGEECDGDNWGNVFSCSDITPGLSGTPSCDPQTCRFDSSACENNCPLFCGADGLCEENCAFESSCTPDPDCAGGGSCSLSCGLDGLCEEGCALDASCSLDPDCVGQEEPRGETCPLSCGVDGVCSEACSENLACLPDPDCEGGFNWFALVLVILGVSTIGGSGYYLYLQYNERQQSNFRSSSGSSSFPGGQQNRSPASGRFGSSNSSSSFGGDVRARAQQQIADQERRRREELFKQRSEVRDKRRHSTFDSFGPAPGASTKKSSMVSPPSGTPSDSSRQVVSQDTRSKNTSSSDEEFVSLDDVRKRQERLRELMKQSKERVAQAKAGSSSPQRASSSSDSLQSTKSFDSSASAPPSSASGSQDQGHVGEVPASSKDKKTKADDPFSDIDSLIKEAKDE